MSTLTKVTREQFFATVGKLDVHPSSRNVPHTHPEYGADWNDRYGIVRGVSIQRGPTPHYKPDTDYYIAR